MKKNLKNYIITSTVIFIILTAILYGIAAFIALDFNPKGWDEFGRFIIAVMDCFLLILAIAVPIVFLEE